MSFSAINKTPSTFFAADSSGVLSKFPMPHNAPTTVNEIATMAMILLRHIPSKD
jgi:hypothetical protein